LPGSHLLKNGVDIRVIQVLLGHAKLDNAALYTRVAPRTVRTVISPLDRIASLMAEKAGSGGCSSHSFSFDHRRRPETFFTAMATAFFWPTRTTKRLPRVTPV
jgi:hypothetical protein